MHVVACLNSYPMLIEPARRRDIALLPFAEVPEAPVRLAAWVSGDGCMEELLRTMRGGQAGARAMLLVDDAATLAAALDVGADDAAMVAASPVEIVARLSALLRAARDGDHLTIGDLTIDRASRIVRRGGVALDLLPREYAVLLRLAEQGGGAVSRAALLRDVWGREFDPGTNVVQVQMSRLRAKLDAAGPPILHTDRGRGYRLSGGGGPGGMVSGAKSR